MAARVVCQFNRKPHQLTDECEWVTYLPGDLLDPHGRVIGAVDGLSRTHRCEPGCRLHDPCCPEYFYVGLAWYFGDHPDGPCK